MLGVVAIGLGECAVHIRQGDHCPDRAGTGDHDICLRHRGRKLIDRRWRAFRDKKLASAGHSRAEQLSAAFDASASWSKASGGKGCSMVNAHAEFSDRSHPVFAVIAEQKQEMLDVFRRILATDGQADERLVEAIMLLHEGALVADGIGIGTDPFDVGRDAALEMLKHSG